MSELGIAAALTVLGAFLGSVISPAVEIMFRRVFSEHSDEEAAADGLVLLSAANAAWVVSFVFWGRIADSRGALATVIILYVVAGVLFIGSFQQFRRGKGLQALSDSRHLLLAIVIGSGLWLSGESAEVILAMFGLDSFPHLTLKYIFLLAAALVFFGGAAMDFRRRR